MTMAVTVVNLCGRAGLETALAVPKCDGLSCCMTR